MLIVMINTLDDQMNGDKIKDEVHFSLRRSKKKLKVEKENIIYMNETNEQQVEQQMENEKKYKKREEKKSERENKKMIRGREYTKQMMMMMSKMKMQNLHG